MTSRQHVGAVSSEAVVDIALETERARRAILERVARPIPRERGPIRDYGDGDRCPTAPTHGHMYVEGDRQYCPHHDHDYPILTRSLWPLYMTETETTRNLSTLPDLPDLEV